MRLEFERIDSLPRLAWCARLHRGGSVAHVRHGAWVETREDRWVEGVWDGSFEEGRFDEAFSLAGTGGRIDAEGILFSGSTGRGDRIHLTRRDDELIVSNSLVFALVEAGDEPDSRFPYYEHEFFRISREGVLRRDPTLRTHKGRIRFYDCFNVRVGRDLSVAIRDKRVPPAPTDFKDYVAFLDGCFARLFANGADPARSQAYTPRVPVSRGYDSPPLAVLAARHGFRKALTFTEIAPGKAQPDDDGTPIAESLEMEMQRYPLPQSLAVDVDAEFAVCPHGSARAWAVVEPELPGCIVVSGATGGDTLSVHFAAPEGLTRDPSRGLAGTQTEFRLRVGFHIFKPWFIGWQNAEDVRRITLSDEMRPYRVGGDYDRPIPRRIAEEAGIPRDLFGQRKFAGGQRAILRPRDLYEEGQRDYREFVRSLSLPRWLICGIALARGLDRRLPDGGWAKRMLQRRVPARWRMSLDKGYLFHWGFHRTADRYRSP